MFTNVKRKLTIPLLIIFGVVLTIFGLTACGGNKENKIDIGERIVGDEPMLSVSTRVMLDHDIFTRDSEIKFTVGFGFLYDDIQSIVANGRLLVLKISADNFVIVDNEANESEHLYKKTFAEYTDIKFFSTRKYNRYVPNYYESFKLRVNSEVENISGVITIQAGVQRGEDNIDGYWVSIFYVTNGTKIAFSSISKADAEKKLKFDRR